MATSVSRQVRCYVDGQWVESPSSQGQEVENPATGEVLAEVPFCSREEVDDIVGRAKAAFPKWRRTSPVERIQPLFKLKALMEDRVEDLAKTLTLENGKTFNESMGEMRRTIENLEVASGIPTLMQGSNLEDVSAGIDESAIRQPLGVFACIAPFNFPAMVPWWFAPYAMATGNTYLIKPSEQTPLTQELIFELIHEAGFPPGVINLVHGSKETVDALIEHPDIEGISFVGSTPIAQAIYQKAAVHGKRVQCQGGAKNFLVIMPDADLDFSVDAASSSAFGCAGQRCLAGSATITVGDIHEPFLKGLRETAQAIKVGNGLDEGNTMGPVISKGSKSRVLEYLELGTKEGAEVALDGRQHESADSAGNFVGPSVIENVNPDMSVANEEIFGPVISTLHAETLDEALDIIERNPYGNAASIFTQSGKAAREFKYRVPCGNLGINVGVAAPMAFFPFAGMKDSFFGDLHGQGQDAIRFFTDYKVVIERW